MKHPITLLFLTLFLTSCISVKFKSLKSLEKGRLIAFPKSYRGYYVSKDNDTLIINESTLNMGYDSLEGKYLIDTLKRGSYEIAKFNKYLIICKKDDKYWDFIPVVKKGNEIKVYYLDPEEFSDKKFPMVQDSDKKNELFFNELNKITKTEKIFKERENLDFYLIDPSESELEILLSNGFFSPLDTLRRIESP